MVENSGEILAATAGKLGGMLISGDVSVYYERRLSYPHLNAPFSSQLKIKCSQFLAAEGLKCSFFLAAKSPNVPNSSQQTLKMFLFPRNRAVQFISIHFVTSA